MEARPVIHSMSRAEGVADTFAITAQVSYPPHSTEPHPVTFTSSAQGAPIVMVTGNNVQTFISARVLDRIGRTLDEEWIRRFFAPQDAQEAIETDIGPVAPYTAPFDTDTAFSAQMARGHYMRTGHQLRGKRVSADGVLWHLWRECCNEPMPTLTTFEAHVPDMGSAQ